jgi:hypothetical protein
VKRKPPDKTQSGLRRSSFGRKPADPKKTASAKTSVGRSAPKSPLALRREAVKRAAINALKRVKRTADKAGVELSQWEDEFLGSVQDRVKTYGRAFGDPEKGGQGEALSLMQVVKLKEINAKAKGETAKRDLRKRFRRKPSP